MMRVSMAGKLDSAGLGVVAENPYTVSICAVIPLGIWRTWVKGLGVGDTGRLGALMRCVVPDGTVCVGFLLSVVASLYLLAVGRLS